MSHDAKKPKGRAWRTRWDRGQIRWTERDIKTLTWIGEQYAVRFDLPSVCGSVALGPSTRKSSPLTGRADGGS